MRQIPTHKGIFTSFTLLPITPNQEQLRVSFLVHTLLVECAMNEIYHRNRFVLENVEQELDLCGKT